MGTRIRRRREGKRDSKLPSALSSVRVLHNSTLVVARLVDCHRSDGQREAHRGGARRWHVWDAQGVVPGGVHVQFSPWPGVRFLAQRIAGYCEDMVAV